MEHMKRYLRVWTFFRTLLAPWLKRKFNYSPEICSEEGPFLLLANHNTDWDPLLLACAFPKYLSFVASEHIFRWGFKGKLIIFLLNPIARLKGTTAADTAMTMLRRLRKGVNVAMFAEGNRSFNGLTGTVFPATGKLARTSGVPLVTYRLDGGYFTSPRWSGKDLRRGKMTGKVVHVYSAQELKQMTPAQINEAIYRDLYVDAYEVQRTEMIPFKGKNLAEHLETVFCICPKCGEIGTLHSHGDLLNCKCGFQVKYNEYGFFEGEDAPFDNITEWDLSQTKQLYAFADNSADLIFSDKEMTLTEVLADHSYMECGTGEIALYRDRLECCGRTFPLKELGGFALLGPQTIDMSSNGKSYEISSTQVRCARKYLLVIDYLRTKNSAETAEQ